MLKMKYLGYLNLALIELHVGPSLNSIAHFSLSSVIDNTLCRSNQKELGAFVEVKYKDINEALYKRK